MVYTFHGPYQILFDLLPLPYELGYNTRHKQKNWEQYKNEHLTNFKMKIFQELSWVHVKFGFFVSGQKCGFGVIMARGPLRHFAAFEGHCPLRNNVPKSNP